MSDESDEDLMLRYQRGDVTAFEQLLMRYQRYVYNFILQSVADRATAEDLLQETFLRVIKGSGTYEARGQFRTWLFTIARRLCIDASRLAHHRRSVSLDAPLGEHGDGYEVAADPAVDVDRTVMDRQAGERIAAAVAELGGEQREVFVMREVLGLDYKAIAEIVGANENTVRSRMRYALERLRLKLEDYSDLSLVAQ